MVDDIASGSVTGSSDEPSGVNAQVVMADDIAGIEMIDSGEPNNGVPRVVVVGAVAGGDMLEWSSQGRWRRCRD